MRVLFVAMSQCVHAVRWIRQLMDRDWDLHLFSSGGYDVHPEHRDITIHGASLFVPRTLSPTVKLRSRWPFPHNYFLGQIQRFLPGLLNEPLRLARLIDKLKPDIVHSLEIQHGGYLALAARELLGGKFPPWIVTNYGSDVYYYRRFPDHEAKLRQVFAACDYLKSECARDVRLAQELGYRGKVCPVTPNAGGFDLTHCATLRSAGPTSARRLILVKGYQHWAGRALTALEAIERSADVLREFRIGVYLADPAVVAAARAIAKRTGLVIEIFPNRSHDEMLRLHGQARMSIGLSISDGVSTSFLEAFVMGSFPIQTCTACADEWLVNGVGGFIVPSGDVAAVEKSIRTAATDDALVDRAAELNRQVAAERLDAAKIRAESVAIYETIMRG